MTRMGFVPPMPRCLAHPQLAKVAKLVDAIEASVEPGCPGQILKACELFAEHKGQWLKVAGMEKAEILEQGLAARPLLVQEVLTEFGVFVGYTAVRLGRATVGIPRPRPGVVSLEVSPVHVCVARHLLDLGQLAGVNEVVAGQAKDILPRVAEEIGASTVGSSFMDHRGTIFHQDFLLLERYGLFARRARFVTDNTLNPGAPLFIWNFAAHRQATQQGYHTATTPFSLSEFQAEHEDWTAVTDRDYESSLPAA